MGGYEEPSHRAICLPNFKIAIELEEFKNRKAEGDET